MEPLFEHKDRLAARQKRDVQLAINSLQRIVDRLPPEELAFVAHHLEKALDREDRYRRTKARAAREVGVPYGGRRERLGAETAVLLRSFRRRRELLEGSLGATEVANLLGTSRQTPHDRAESGTLLAVHERGSLRFPVWQFDPTGRNGVIGGLPDVLRALRADPFAKLSWLVRPNAAFRGKTPVDLLKRGDTQRVLAAARAVEAD